MWRVGAKGGDGGTACWGGGEEQYDDIGRLTYCTCGVKDANVARMSEHRHYTRAPITEALIDIQTVAPDGLTLETLQQLARSLKEAYPQRQDMFKSELEIGPNAEGTSTTVATGYMLRDDGGKHV